MGSPKPIPAPLRRWYLILLATCLPVVSADGVGILGAGKWLYKPTCAHTCRYIVRNNPLLCQTDDGSSTHQSHHTSSAKDPLCWLIDDAFLRTVALCINEYCSRDDVPLSTIEKWWEGHLATGSIGDWSKDMEPAMSYQQALELARDDVKKVGEENVPYITGKAPLNVTSRIAEKEYIATLNYQVSFQWGEFDHGVNRWEWLTQVRERRLTFTSLIIAITLVCLPILLSLGRFIPGYAKLTSRINALLDKPLWGHQHRVPVYGSLGHMPTRGQSIFIAYIIIINVILLCLPLRTLQPNVRMVSHHMQRVQVIGDRAGVLAFCLYIALFLFSSRNNILLWVTDWSHSTYLLLHRWVAYVCIFQTVMHSILLLHYFVGWQDHATESKLPYWYWGIIATLATCFMYPLSLLSLRQKMYEVFLAIHQILAALILITGFLHIWYLYSYNWGYEIWIYAAGGIWFMDKALRVVRIAANGYRTATVTSVDESSDLLRIEIDDIVVEGHVYIYFPSLSWRVWESHPFSVLSSFTELNPQDSSASLDTNVDNEKGNRNTVTAVDVSGSSPSEDHQLTSSVPNGAQAKAVLLVRAQNGTTATLLSRVRAQKGTLSIRVLVESSYHATPSTRNLRECSSFVGIAGGVGITAVLPIASRLAGISARVFWGVKHDDILRSIKPELERYNSKVELHTTIGTRMHLDGILKAELLREDVKGNLGVVVCGPPSMSDDVRKVVTELASSGKANRGVVFIDEAFSW
ncbi:unnamed protein product [Clonostachys chloroleuca]|uniref:Ferric oxidoreductase domain-containing protein n=1 Tax=Clonostachys chloroleuca TaxID=1926264 RepID=A0AA35M2Z8_9HYPO|nr:unnamed protein product [Clonostachys chloroleuca]